ncbi:CinA family protein [Chryseobacterium sp.]|uniref:CinA family protein n=1 Tax=Chryseobacterium sp. TaxID=1871047 RepID=UPI0011CBB0B6|nr:CinA family protein [Chryseobacterium sp.]TXF74924.1 CinA family protein [Chryseobacterium sp.]
MLNKNLAQLSKMLTTKNLTLAVAESCTSGLIQNNFSQTKEAMAFFQGGMTVYNAGQKTKHLGINPIAAENCNSVSKEICEKMAVEVAAKFNAEIGISITGYAQPFPEKKVDDCFAFIAVSKNSEIILSKRIKGAKDKDIGENQQIYAEKVVKELLIFLKKDGD